VPTLGKVTVDVGWGGMFYIIADVRQFDGLTLLPERGRDITRTSALILRAAQDQLEVAHRLPGHRHHDRPAVGPHRQPARRPSLRRHHGQRPHHLRRPLDLHAKGELTLHQPFRHEGLLGTVYTGELVEEIEIAGRASVVPTIVGQGMDLRVSSHVLDPMDPFTNGSTVGDLWA
jgi:proline racemase